MRNQKVADWKALCFSLLCSLSFSLLLSANLPSFPGINLHGFSSENPKITPFVEFFVFSFYQVWITSPWPLFVGVCCNVFHGFYAFCSWFWLFVVLMFCFGIYGWFWVGEECFWRCCCWLGVCDVWCFCVFCFIFIFIFCFVVWWIGMWIENLVDFFLVFLLGFDWIWDFFFGFGIGRVILVENWGWVKFSWMMEWLVLVECCCVCSGGNGTVLCSLGVFDCVMMICIFLWKFDECFVMSWFIVLAFIEVDSDLIFLFSFLELWIFHEIDCNNSRKGCIGELSQITEELGYLRITSLIDLLQIVLFQWYVALQSGEFWKLFQLCWLEVED